MTTRWSGDPVDEVALDATLARLVREVSRLLDRLEAAPAAPGSAWGTPRWPPSSGELFAEFPVAFTLAEFTGTALLTVAAVEAPVTPALGAGPPAPLRSPAR